MTTRLGRKPEDPDYGVGEHTIDLDELGLIGESELTDRLNRTFESPNYQPPRLPAVATELLSLAQNPDVEFSEIEKLLERDAMLAGEVLSLARSAFYSRSRPVDSMRAALVLLGLRKLQDVVMQAAMNLRVFRSPAYGPYMDRLRHHCRATAHLSRIVALHTPISEEQAFLCGLLHDVGVAGILLVLGDVERGQSPPDLEMLWPAIDGAHAKAGARMVELWGLPPDIHLAVGAHHQVRIEGFEHPLAATVCVAESLAAELGLSFTPTRHGQPAASGADAGLVEPVLIDQTNDATLEIARASLGLGQRAMDQVRAAARKWLETEAG